MSAAVMQSAVQSPARWKDHIDAAKPRLTALVAVAVAVGFHLAADSLESSWPTLVWTCVGMLAVVGGANAVNQVLERKHDARMLRTADRPVASGRIGGRHVLAWAVPVSVAGLVCLLQSAGSLGALLAAIAWVLYVAVYTPLKRVTPWSVVVGAIPGALPPVVGWVAAGGELGLAPFSLFAVMVVWQLPHFFAIAWMYCDDYANAGYRVLPVVDRTGRRLIAQMIGYSILLIPVSLLPTYIGLTGSTYYFGAFVLGFAFLAFSVEVVRLRTRASAAQHLMASLSYLTLLFALMVVDKVSA